MVVKDCGEGRLFHSIIVHEKGSTPGKFGKYLSLLAEDRKRNYVDDVIVVNAWNEWAEGAVLEPTEHDGFAYLEAIKTISQL